MTGNPSAFELLLAMTACPPVASPIEAAPVPNDSNNVSAERVGLERPTAPVVAAPTTGETRTGDTTIPAIGRPEPVAHTLTANVPAVPLVDETRGLPDEVSAPVATDEIRSAPTTPQIDTAPCPVPVQRDADNSAVEKYPSLSEPPLPETGREQDSTALDRVANLTQRLADDTALPPTRHQADVALDEITDFPVPKALPPTDAVQTPVEEEATATEPVSASESRPGRPDSSRETPALDAELPAFAPVELKQPAAKDFFKQFHRVESLNEQFSQPEFAGPSRPNAAATALHTALTALASDSRIDERQTAPKIDSQQPSAPPDRDSSSSVMFSPLGSPATSLQKSNAIVPGTVTEQLASAVLSQLETEPLSTSRTFRLRRAPRELGPVEVQLTVVNDVISIRFVAHDESARHAISRQLDELRQSLTDSGISFGQFDVSSQTGSDHGSQSRGEDPAPRRPLAPTPSAWSRYQTHELRDERHSGHLNFVA